MKKFNIAVLGYGISKERTEAVSINTLKLEKKLKKFSKKVLRINLGYKNNYFYSGNSLAQALILYPFVFTNLISLLKKKKITHVHDVFVLPLASLIFTLPLKIFFPQIIFIKEIQNDAGSSKKFHLETIIRMLTNRQWMLNLLLKNFKCYTKNLTISKKYSLTYLPLSITVYKKERKKSQKLRVSYLGHPLKKKGIDVFPKIFESLPSDLKNKIIFSFALSDVGPRDQVKKMLLKSAKENRVKVSFSQRVKPHSFFSKQDIYVLPIHDQFSAVSTPNTLLEAMEAGAIPIVTQLSSLKGIVHHRKTAFLIKNITGKKIAKLLQKVAEKQSLLQTLRNNGRQYILENYSDKKVNKVLESIYET